MTAGRAPGEDPQRFVGRRSATVVAPDPVNAVMIHHWCQVFGNSNRCYLDPDFAAASRFGEMIAPAAMTQVWLMTPYGQAPPEDAVAELYALLDDLGYRSIVATNSRQTYLQPLRLGDQLSAVRRIKAVSDEKTTRLGRGRFVTNDIEVVDGDGRIVATQMLRHFKFQPAKPAGESGVLAPATGPADAGDTPGSGTLTRRGGAWRPSPSRRQAEGRLPDLIVPITHTFITAGALATRDFQPVHHDMTFAIAQGLRDVITNIWTTHGLVSRFLTDWGGPDAMVTGVDLRLGDSAYPGDTLTLSGQVGAVERDTGRGDLVATIEFRGDTDRGVPVTGTATLSLLEMP